MVRSAWDDDLRSLDSVSLDIETLAVLIPSHVRLESIFCIVV